MPQTKALHKPASSVVTGNLKWAIAVTVALATFMEVLDDTSVSVALEQIGGNLGAAQDDVTWVVTALLVAKAVVLPLAGFLATTFGRTRLFTICLLAYGAASLLCGLAPSLSFLIGMRIVQGLSGGMLSPLAQAILTDSFPASQRGLAFAVYGVATVVAPTVGPLFCGYLVDNASWHWVFFVNVPVAIITAFLVSVLVKDPPTLAQERADRKKKGLGIDYVGISLLALGLSTLQYVLSRGQREDWFNSGLITWLTVVMVVALGVGIVWEWRSRQPVLDVRLFTNRTFAAAVAVMFAVGIILFSGSTQIPLFLQSLLGYSAQDSGLAITPGGLAILGLLPIVGVLTGKIQARWIILFGLLISAAAQINYAHVLSTDISFRGIALARVYQSVGLAFLFIPINVAAYVGLAKTKTNQAATIINLAQTLGGSFGIAGISTMVARRTQFHQNRLIEGLDPSNPQFTASLQGLTDAFAGAQGSVVDAAQRAQATLYQVVQRQAGTYAYADAFYLLGIACLVAVPLAFIMKANKPGAGEQGAA